MTLEEMEVALDSIQVKAERLLHKNRVLEQQVNELEMRAKPTPSIRALLQRWLNK